MDRDTSPCSRVIQAWSNLALDTSLLTLWTLSCFSTYRENLQVEMLELRKLLQFLSGKFSDPGSCQWLPKSFKGNFRNGQRNGVLTEKLFEGLTPISTLENVAFKFWFQSEVVKEYCASDGIFEMGWVWPRPEWVQL